MDTGIPRIKLRSEQVRGVLGSLVSNTFHAADGSILTPAKKNSDNSVTTYSNTKRYVLEGIRK